MSGILRAAFRTSVSQVGTPTLVPHDLRLHTAREDCG